MRVAVFSDVFPVAAESPFLNILTGLVRRGHEVDVFAERPQPRVAAHPDVAASGLDRRTHYPRPLGQGLGRARAAAAAWRAADPGARAALLRSLDPLRFGGRALSLRAFASALRFAGRREYDAIYCAFGPEGRAAVRLREAGLIAGPIVTSFRGTDLLAYPARKGPRAYARLFRSGERFLPVCEAFVPRLVALGCPADRITVHPSGIAVGRYPFRTPRPPAPGGPVRALVIARLIENKGVQVALRAQRMLRDEGIDLRIDVAGEGPYRRALEAEIAQLGPGDAATLLGQQPQAEVIARLAAADLVLAPSCRAADGSAEGIPNALKEAMACGVPVVSTRLEGIPELVHDRVTGRLAEPGDPASLAQALRELLAERDRWPAYAAAARALVERAYDIDVLNDRFVSLLDSLRARA